MHIESEIWFVTKFVFDYIDFESVELICYMEPVLPTKVSFITAEDWLDRDKMNNKLEIGFNKYN